MPFCRNTPTGYVRILGDRTSIHIGILGTDKMTPRIFAIPLLAVFLAACQPGDTARPVPSVQQIGSDLKCSSGDHGYADPVGWGFCYPQHWKYNVRAQPSADLRGLQELDITFDITDVPCVTPSPVAGQGTPQPICDPDILCVTPSASPGSSGQPSPVCTPQVGLFGYMIVSTYQRAGSPNLASWLQDDLRPVPDATPITWGNAVEAVRLADGRRVALTASQVIVLDLRSGVGNLDLESAMSSRLATWKFYY